MPTYTPVYSCKNCGKKLFAHHVRPGGKFQAVAAAGGPCPKCNHIGSIESCAPQAAPPPAPVKPTTAKAAPVKNPRGKVPKLFSEFLEGRCKNLKQAAKIIGVSARPPLIKQTIRAAWISQIAKHHPDRGGKLEAAQAINAAYQLLQKFAN